MGPDPMRGGQSYSRSRNRNSTSGLFSIPTNRSNRERLAVEYAANQIRALGCWDGRPRPRAAGQQNGIGLLRLIERDIWS